MKSEMLDEWQKEILETEGNIVLRSGRQTGKSTIISIKAGEYAIKNKDKSVMIISHSERQAYLLFSKVLSYLLDNYKDKVKTGTQRPTKSEIRLKNGSIIRCLPCGLNGSGIRGFTVDMLIADEAAFIPADVWPAVTPMLATTQGSIILLSTPLGIDNFFYECYHNPAFKTFHISSEDCPRISKEFLENEKKRLTKLQYQQEYLGEFTGSLRQLFGDELIRDCMKLKRSLNRTGEFYMGVDVARMGGDEFVVEILRKANDELVEHVENFTTTRILIPEVIEKIKEFNRQYFEFEKIYIDTGGMGVAVFDFLLRDDECKRKVVSIDNATRPIERDTWDKSGRRKPLMKEHLYMNLKSLMEQKRISLLDDEEIFFSLKSVQMEVLENGDLKIFGNYTHIAEALIRAAQGFQNKSLNIWIRSK